MGVSEPERDDSEIKRSRLDRNIKCPTCGYPMKLKATQKYKWKNGEDRLFYACTLWPICETSLSSHPSGEPYGTPADRETKALRIRCHGVFDRWWGEFGLTRKRSYELLQELMGLTEGEAHFSNFTKEQCLEFLRRAEGREPHNPG